MVNKEEIARRIASREICSISDAKLQVEIVMKVIREALKDGEKVRISGLGTLYPKHYESHVGYNPFNNGAMVVPSYKTVTWKISKDLKKELNAKSVER